VWCLLLVAVCLSRQQGCGGGGGGKEIGWDPSFCGVGGNNLPPQEQNKLKAYRRFVDM